METLRNKKVFLIKTLSADSSYVLQFAQQYEIIIDREYGVLNHPNHNGQDIITKLLDIVRNKGEETSKKFIELLKNEDLQATFPQLREHFRRAPPAVPVAPEPLAPPAVPVAPEPLAPPALPAAPEPIAPSSLPAASELLACPGAPESPAAQQDGPAQPYFEIDEYRMSEHPRGFCVIINNMDFSPNNKKDKYKPLEYREGSEKDTESLKKVFDWLGFTVFEYKDQTAEQMKTILQTYGKETHNGDCFVCCMLSHGSAEGVYGTDGGVLSSKDIFGPFSGISCPSLANKPKAFFIQACRGTYIQQLVLVKADNAEEMETAEVRGKSEMAVKKWITIPDDADFFVARSSVKGFASVRDPSSGSWFIQSLCKQLIKFCPQGEDILHIMLCVNKEVSRAIAKVKVSPQEFVIAKQMPNQSMTLTKKLVFHVPPGSTAPPILGLGL